MLLAKALYDNIAESPEELAMCRGDLLTVLERDTSGLEGWWLCLLKGRRGIVPGNRLRVLDTALSQHELMLLNANLSSADERSLAPKEWHNPNKVVIPQRLGDMFVYDLPKRTASTGHYDVPPRRAPIASPRIQTLPRDRNRPRPAPRSVAAASASDYDHPASNRPLNSKLISGPDPGRGASPVDHYDVPGSNRSSTLSVMSTGSNLSALSGGSGAQSSLYESERSSLDLSGHDTYDVPPPARAVPTPAPRGPPTGSSVDSPMYDTPKSTKHGHKHSKSLDLFEERADSLRREASSDAIINCADGLHTYAVPTSGKPISRNCSADSGISLKNQADASSVNTYDVPIPQQYDAPSRCKSAEDGLGYDTPKSRDAVCDASSKAVTSSADVSVYDVPPRVTKDTGGSSLRQATDDVKRVSSGSSDSEIGSFPYEELRMELTAAMESIVGLQHNVNSSCSKLLSFVCPAWRHPDNLEPKVYEIKLSALAVRTSGREFVEFAHGALANAVKSDDRRLAKKLGSAVESLSELLNTFGERLQRLNADMWPLVRLVRDEESGAWEEDDLDIMIRLTRDIPECVRRVSGLIQGNSMVLFRRNESPNVGAAPPGSAPRPKAPPPVKPKPRLSTGGGAPLARFVSKSVDSTPTSEDPPSVQTSLLRTDAKGEPGLDAGKLPSFDQLDYDVPKASPAKALSEQFDSSQRGLPDGANTIEEYDYVSLTKEPTATSGSSSVAKDQKEAVIQPSDVPVYAQVQKDESRGRQVKSLFPPPDVSTSGLSPKFQERLEKLQLEAEEPVKVHTDDYDIPPSRPVEEVPPHSQSFGAAPISPNDRQILSFYAIQMEKHSAILMNAIEAFIRCIDEQQPPKTFIAYSKYVILAAHKLVYIGDTLTRHLTHENIRNDIVSQAFGLCELLKGTVTATKKAALEYPAVKAVQEMVDKVSEVSVAANQFKNFLTQFAS